MRPWHRCWKAYHLGDNGKEIRDKQYIIKDSWRSISRRNTEGDLLKKASVALKSVNNPRIEEYYHHEDITLSNTGMQEKMIDDTLVCIRKGLCLPVSFDRNNNRIVSQPVSNEHIPGIYSVASSNAVLS